MKTCILGTGSWGSAFARHLAHKWDDVVMWGIDEAAVASINSDAVNPDYLEDCQLPPNVGATLDMKVANLSLRLTAFIRGDVKYDAITRNFTEVKPPSVLSR